VRIKDMRSRWGSCSSSGALSFSWRLVLAPRQVLEYVVAHEIAHILNHINKKTPFILDNLNNYHVNSKEAEANKLAAEKLKHPEILKYLDPYLGYLTKSKVEDCAGVYEVHPAIIIGKLAFDKKISHGNQSLFNENVLEQIEKRYQVGNQPNEERIK